MSRIINIEASAAAIQLYSNPAAVIDVTPVSDDVRINSQLVCLGFVGDMKLAEKLAADGLKAANANSRSTMKQVYPYLKQTCIDFIKSLRRM